jgi:hypothetical protein
MASLRLDKDGLAGHKEIIYCSNERQTGAAKRAGPSSLRYTSALTPPWRDILNRTAAEGVVISMATYEVLGRDPCGGQPLIYSL